ncbi:Cyclopropane-fatty-acyl-phospholipid synthase [Thioalkalivibrio nitratireducens DSM 14787]|uniref:Cyclopropane-fatty-acyl-phospholipid synthase n=1 Tax=Thioalkalivibrio nitratireducens (strain DSM 14787 / UNIQEM 213 / ALEN2) TaxID=1255043 RepID=L0DW74_THIND|nr:cyclopropane-fatty-acyl-phospholipid synthase family protein [Thioalkalivibrio nitratireducens]AGA33844.1 Cyclopropane-fatty-acyl-phospholipid synthase [Thioalkalivibrio nitratireducens DSM 14787]
MTLLGLLEEYVRDGTLRLELPDGSRREFGSGTPQASIHLHDAAVMRRIAYDPGFEFGQTYMEGGWDPGQHGLRAVLDITMRNFAAMFAQRARHPLGILRKLLQQGNRVRRAYRNVAHHYDLDEWLFRRFLDRGMFYSCAYFERPEMTLEQAQEAKCRIIARKLCLQPGMRVLDIGSGWGGLAMHLAEHHGVRVDGLTLSREQLRVASEECTRRGLDDRVEFHLRDYREHQGRYDRIVSVGMFEHVGQPYYGAFFRQVDDLLGDDGVMLLHTIGRTNPPGTTNAWLRRYIFPGGYTPALSELTAASEPTDLMITDVEVWRLHYADTLAEWFRRFQEIRAEAAEHFDERFCRMWEFYLASCEGTFRHWDQIVFQVQLSKDRQTVPITRDYLCGD